MLSYTSELIGLQGDRAVLLVEYSDERIVYATVVRTLLGYRACDPTICAKSLDSIPRSPTFGYCLTDEHHALFVEAALKHFPHIVTSYNMGSTSMGVHTPAGAKQALNELAHIYVMRSLNSTYLADAARGMKGVKVNTYIINPMQGDAKQVAVIESMGACSSPVKLTPRYSVGGNSDPTSCALTTYIEASPSTCAPYLTLSAKPRLLAFPRHAPKTREACRLFARRLPAAGASINYLYSTLDHDLYVTTVPKKKTNADGVAALPPIRRIYGRRTINDNYSEKHMS